MTTVASFTKSLAMQVHDAIAAQEAQDADKEVAEPKKKKRKKKAAVVTTPLSKPEVVESSWPRLAADYSR